MSDIHEKQDRPILINWTPDRASGVPLYSQIVSYFSGKISRGEWVSGQSIPSQRRLSERFGVNRSTIVEAMDELAAMGLIERHFGGGTRIASDSWAALMHAKSPNWKRYITAGTFRSNIPTVQTINHLEFEEGIVRLSTGELSPELVQMDLAKKALASLSERRLFMNYPDPLGMPGLRLAVQAHLKRSGINVPITCILIVSGALQALQLIASGIVQPRSAVYMESPSYLKSLNILQSAGATLTGVPMDKDGILPWMIHNQPREGVCSLLYTIPTFQNPTGIVMPEERRLEVLKYCAEQHMPIIEDDVFCDLWLDAPPPPPLKALDKSGGVVYIGSLSKCFSPGLRLGWLVGPEPVVDRLADIKMQMDYGVSVLTQQVTEELLNSGLYYEGINVTRAQLRERRNFMLRLLEEFFGDLAEWNRPTGGFFVWVKLKHQLSAERIFNLALKEKLLVPPGSIYDPLYTSHLRLTYGYLSMSEMESGIRRLSQIVRSLL